MTRLKKWGRTIGLVALLTFGYAVGVARAIGERSPRVRRWGVRLGNAYVWALRKVAEIGTRWK